MSDLENLQELYESVLLMEMPHIRFVLGGREFLFDLKIERYKGNWNGLVSHIKDYLDRFASQKERIKFAFMKELENYPSVNVFFNRYFGKSLEDLKNEI